MEKLAKIQAQLKAPKSSHNDFGNYNFRSAEQILEAVKPYLDGATILLSDELVVLGEEYTAKTDVAHDIKIEDKSLRVYIKATATFIDGDFSQSVSAYAREDKVLKGMASAQVTGACSSYARKYALCGLLAIDNNNDVDTMDNRHVEMITYEQQQKLKDLGTDFDKLCAKLGVNSVDEITKVQADTAIQIKMKQNAKI